MLGSLRLLFGKLTPLLKAIHWLPSSKERNTHSTTLLVKGILHLLPLCSSSTDFVGCLKYTKLTPAPGPLHWLSLCLEHSTCSFWVDFLTTGFSFSALLPPLQRLSSIITESNSFLYITRLLVFLLQIKYQRHRPSPPPILRDERGKCQQPTSGLTVQSYTYFCWEHNEACASFPGLSITS